MLVRGTNVRAANRPRPVPIALLGPRVPRGLVRIGIRAAVRIEMTRPPASQPGVSRVGMRAPQPIGASRPMTSVPKHAKKRG